MKEILSGKLCSRNFLEMRRNVANYLLSKFIGLGFQIVKYTSSYGIISKFCQPLVLLFLITLTGRRLVDGRNGFEWLCWGIPRKFL